MNSEISPKSLGRGIILIKRLRFLNLTTALMLVWSSAFAQVPEELQEIVMTGNVFGREDDGHGAPSFSKNANNIKTVVTTGSKGKVLQTVRLKSSGSYGVKVRLTEVGKGKTNAKPGDEVWVYYSPKNPWIKFRDTKDMEVQNPENALTAKARQNGEGITTPPSAPAPADDKSVDPNEAMPSGDIRQTEAGTGNSCLLNNSCGTSANHKAMKGVADKIIDDEIKNRPREVIESELKEQKQKKEKKKLEALFTKYKKRKYIMEENDWNNFPGIAKYSNDSRTTKMIKVALRDKESESTSNCYKYVKRAGLASDWLKYYPPGGSAKDAVKDYKAQGFTNLMDPPYRGIIKTPDDAPKGAVVVYATSDPNEHGDIQIKTDWGTSGGYVSDFVRPRDMSAGKDGSFMTFDKAKRFARKGKPYKIIGVMVKI